MKLVRIVGVLAVLVIVVAIWMVIVSRQFGPEPKELPGKLQGRVLAMEILVPNPAIRNLIREAKVAQMYSAIQTGAQAGMQTLDQCLTELVAKGVVSKEEARYKASNKDAL